MLNRLTTQFLLTSETIRRPRIVLIASDFPAGVTASVVWLNEQGVRISLIRLHPYQLADKQVVVSFSRLFPVSDVEEFTIGRRPATATVGAAAEDAGPPWNEEALRHLAQRGNPATLALLDLCAAPDPGYVEVENVAAQAGVTKGAVRGQLAGLTMLLKSPANGFSQNFWPVSVEWMAGGVASYSMDAELAVLWRAISPARRQITGERPQPPLRDVLASALN